MASPQDETGRYIMFFYPGALSEVSALARRTAGIAIPATVEAAESATVSEEWREAEAIVIPALNAMVCAAEPEQARRLAVDNRSPIRRMRKEYYFRIAALSEADANYWRGYRDATNTLVNTLLGHPTVPADFITADDPAFTDSADLTWGLQSIGIPAAVLTGKDIRVAVLDTGFDHAHPDLSDRGFESQSFVAGIATAQDDHGHGTHCVGTVAGPRSPKDGPRYGVAPDARMFVGKVMDSTGRGKEGDILHGIGWALQNQCRVISMSFGKAVGPGVPPDSDYDEIGSIALSMNCVLIAAAGNQSHRPGHLAPVEMPANSKTFMAVGALNRHLLMYSKSNGGINRDGGGVDLVGPGVDVRSSKRVPLLYGLDTGTSMATPHVAGVAALLFEADPSATAEQIWTRLAQNADRLPLSSTDVGAGLVQAV